jgi:hypothetical protein
LYYLFFSGLWHLIAPLVSFCYCLSCSSLVYDIWLPLWCLSVIVLVVLLWFMTSDYPFGVSLLLYYLFFFGWWHVIIPLVSFCYCISCTSLVYDIWLPIWCLSVIVLFVLLWFMTSDCPFGVYLLLYYLFFFGLRHLIAPLVSFCCCIICSSLVYGIWLPRWCLSVIVLVVLFWFMTSDCPFGVFLLLYYLFFFCLCHLIAPLVSFCCCIICSSLIYWIWLPLWCLFIILLFVLLWFTAYDCHFGVFLLMYYVFFFALWHLIALLVSFCHCIICSSLVYWIW